MHVSIIKAVMSLVGLVPVPTEWPPHCRDSHALMEEEVNCFDSVCLEHHDMAETKHCCDLHAPFGSILRSPLLMSGFSEAIRAGGVVGWGGSSCLPATPSPSSPRPTVRLSRLPPP